MRLMATKLNRELTMGRKCRMRTLKLSPTSCFTNLRVCEVTQRRGIFFGSGLYFLMTYTLLYLGLYLGLFRFDFLAGNLTAIWEN